MWDRVTWEVFVEIIKYEVGLEINGDVLVTKRAKAF